VSPRQLTVIDVAVRNVGLRRSVTALTYLAMYGAARNAAGEAVKPEQVGAHWQRSDASVFRDQAVFRLAFPGEASPERLWLALGASVHEKRAERAGARLAALPWPVAP